MSEITEYCILGERCTGTNYLKKLMDTNFNLKESNKFGWKHFFGFSDYKDSDNVLFIGIVRDPFQWLGSLNKKKHHFPPHLKKNMRSILLNPFFSIYDSKEHGEKYGKEIMEDRNIYTGKRYYNIVDLRNNKNKFLLDDMPKKVKHYILIRYEDLSTKTFEELEKLKNQYNLIQKNNELINIVKHTKKKGARWDENHEVYKPTLENFKLVRKLINIEQEHRLGYLLHIKIDSNELKENKELNELKENELEENIKHNKIIMEEESLEG